MLGRLSGEVTELKLFEEEACAAGLRRTGENGPVLSRPESTRIRFSDTPRQFAGADEIVIAAPYWDLSFPSILKVYLEQICITGITFQYTPEGIPEGLCRARHIIYVTTAGGPVYQNMGFDYVKALSDAFFGIHEQVGVYRAES